MTLGILDEALSAGARLKPACEVLGLNPSTVQRWRARGPSGDARNGPRSKSKSALCDSARAEILEIANWPEFRSKSPKQIVPTLLDQGIYVASEASFSRVLRDAKQLKHRETSKQPTKRPRPTPLVATGPNQVWSWNITYLHTLTKGSFYYLYLVLDVWSRKIVGFEVHECESAQHASRLIDASCEFESIMKDQLTLHSDNGAPMKGSTMLATLQELGVAAAFSRQSVSNDNPFSESAFRTLKYRPEYPAKPFESLEHAREFVEAFVKWYNEEHLHSSIKFVTPSDRHAGSDVGLLENRKRVLETARAKRPERWSGTTREWSHTKIVELNPAPSRDGKQTA